MKVRIQVKVSTEGGEQVEEITLLEREQPQLETLGLSLAEGKDILKKIQAVVVERQLDEFLCRERCCPECGKRRQSKGYSPTTTFRTVFGNVSIKNPRLHHCNCQPHEEQTFSPLKVLLAGHISPELLYLETRWASLIPFVPTAELLHEVLPVDEKLNATTIRNHLLAVAERIDEELGEEAVSFIEGYPRDWAELPPPDGPLTIGGFVRAAHKAGHFEVIVGKSVLAFERGAEREPETTRRFGYVQTFDTKPRRRVFELLKSQGMQANQQVVFLSDGGEDVREVQNYLNPGAEHWLDWFHITMRMTVLSQQAKGFRETKAKLMEEVTKSLERIKHFLWHGNVYQAMQEIDGLDLDLDGQEGAEKLAKGVQELSIYVRNNQGFIPNFGERYRQGESVSTAFVESTVNQVVSKRMVKRQQMQWSLRGAHLLLQIRTRVLDGKLEDTFRRWYPNFRPNAATPVEAVSAA